MTEAEDRSAAGALTRLCELAKAEAGRRVTVLPGEMPGEWFVMDGPHRMATLHGFHSAEHDARFLAAAVAAAPALIDLAAATAARLQAARYALRDLIRRRDHDSIDWAGIRTERLIDAAAQALAAGEFDGPGNYCLPDD